MRTVLAAAWLAVSAFPAAAFEMPPVSFDKPFPHMRIEVWPPHKIGEQCRQRHFGNRDIKGQIIGCAVFGTDGKNVVCILILPPGYSERLFRHERAHCHGWEHGYP